MSIRINGISFQYPMSEAPVLTDFSAEFREATITAVVGPNGCGKTTLSKIITGILKPQKGQVLIDAEDVSSLSLAQVGRRLGYVMQNPNQQLFCASVLEEVEYGLKNLGLPQAEIHARIDEYLTYFHIGQYKGKLPFQLSEGEKQRLVLAAILAMKPRYLLLDEPTSALDIVRKKMLGEYLRSICTDMGCGIIVISHDDDFIDAYCAEAVEMQGVGV